MEDSHYHVIYSSLRMNNMKSEGCGNVNGLNVENCARRQSRTHSPIQLGPNCLRNVIIYCMSERLCKIGRKHSYTAFVTKIALVQQHIVDVFYVSLLADSGFILIENSTSR